MEHQSARQLRRRNGRPAACDPCRARKVACDHARPVCRRCHAREQGARCVYSESGPRSLGNVPKASLRSETRFPRIPNVAQSQRHPAAESPAKSNTGYLGAINYSTVLDETVRTLSLTNGSDQNYRLAEQAGHQLASFGELPVALQDMAIFVLQCLPGQLNEQMIFEDHNSTSHGLMHVLVDRIIDSILQLFDTLDSEDETAALETFADILCQNTAQPADRVSTSAAEYFDQFYGNLRWEALGILWLHMDHVSDPIDSPLPRRVVWIDGKKSHSLTRTCVDYCIDLSRHLCQGNDLLVDIARRKASLDTVVDGEGSYSSSLTHGLNVSLTTYLGLHAQPPLQNYQPSFSSEYKRRLFAQVFVSDKLFVCFTGRPPLISRRFCTTPLPLDLSDEELGADPPAFHRAVQSLDDYGWNTQGSVHTATLIRGRYLAALIRDEVIEFALGNPNDVTIDQILMLRDKHQAFYRRLPEGLKYSPQDLEGPASMNSDRFGRLFLQVEHLLSLFLIQRLLLRHGYSDTGDLLITSFDMLVMTLCINHRNRENSQRHSGWLVLSYAVPAGGILCQELLRPTFQGTHPKDSRLTRSSIIQKLSLLVGYLEWVGPSTPNSSLCADSRVVIQRVLDEHLNAPAERSGGEMLESVDWGFPMQLDFNFELLDTFDWLRPVEGE